jgi:cytosine/adenosine deaminase-related metal-dependent hydrolase
MSRSLLIAGGHIAEKQAAATARIRRADLLIEEGIITEVADDLAPRQRDAVRLDAAGCLIVPGLTNAHTHSPENLAAGFCDGLHLEDWLGAVWGRLDHLTDEEIRLAVLSGAVQMLNQGVTAVVDHFRQTPLSVKAFESARSAYEQVGIRALLAPMFRDRLGSDGRMIGAPTGGKPLSLAQTRELWGELARQDRKDGLVRVGVGLSGPTRCSDAMLEMAADFSERHSLLLHSHVSESQAEADAGLALYGQRTLRHLDDIGFLGPRTSLAHCVWIDRHEIECIADSGAMVVHNPVSNMILGCGTAPVRTILDAGGVVALGTDGAASNGAQNLLETIKFAALLPRSGTRDARRWMSASDAFFLSIEGGRRLFGLGSAGISKGSVADIAVFEVPQIALDEFSDPVRQLVYGAEVRARFVLVQGRPLIDRGRITSFDEAALQKELSQYRSFHNAN